MLNFNAELWINFHIIKIQQQKITLEIALVIFKICTPKSNYFNVIEFRLRNSFNGSTHTCICSPMLLIRHDAQITLYTLVHFNGKTTLRLTLWHVYYSRSNAQTNKHTDLKDLIIVQLNLLYANCWLQLSVNYNIIPTNRLSCYRLD